MKDFKGTILLLLTVICYLVAGYIYAYDALHFIWRQAAVVFTFATLIWFSHKNYPVSAIICWGLLFLSATEFVDECFKINTAIRIDDYIFTALGIIGIVIGIITHWKQIK
jgi:hypothetical protein